jgi:hypothetical protein
MTITDLGISGENHHHDGHHHHTTSAFTITITDAMRKCGVCRFGTKGWPAKRAAFVQECSPKPKAAKCMVNRLKDTLNPLCSVSCSQYKLNRGIDGAILIFSVVPLRSKSNHVDFL